MAKRILPIVLACMFWSCDSTPVTRGPGTETETVNVGVRDSATGANRPLARALVRQVARGDWQTRIEQGLPVVLDSAWSDSLGRCRFVPRPGAAYEAAWRDSLMGWDTSSQITLREPAAWTGTGDPGRTIRLRGTSIRSVVDSQGRWGMSVPAGTFQAVSIGPEGTAELGSQTFVSKTSNWDTTTNLGTSVSLVTGLFDSRWHLTRFDGSDSLSAPPLYTDSDTCRTGCPIFAAGSPASSPSGRPYGMGLEILLYGRHVRVIQADHIRIRFFSSTFGFSAFVQPGSPRTWDSTISQMVTTPGNGLVTSEFTVGVGTGEILGGFVLRANADSGRVIVREVLLESTTGVRLDLKM